MKIAADYQWPLKNDFSLDSCMLLVIDMQVDFCGQDGWFEQLGIPLDDAQSPIEPIYRLIETARTCGLEIVHTRESYRPGKWDVADNINWRTNRSGLAYGDTGRLGKVLTRGEPGWQIIERLQPLDEEWVIDKPGKSAFYSTELDLGLRRHGTKHLIICGLTTDVCVQTTMRDAFDLGYECLLVEDACGASKYSNHHAYVELLKTPVSGCGAVASSDTVISFLKQTFGMSSED